MGARVPLTAGVEGPLTGGKHGWPFAAALQDVATGIEFARKELLGKPPKARKLELLYSFDQSLC